MNQATPENGRRSILHPDGLGAPPSAHTDPPATVAGGVAGPMRAADPILQPAANASAAPSRRGFGINPVQRVMTGGRSANKVVIGGVAVAAALVAYFVLPKFGFGPPGLGNKGGEVSVGPSNAFMATPATRPAESRPSDGTGGTASPGGAFVQVTVEESNYLLNGQPAPIDSIVEAAKTASARPNAAPVELVIKDNTRAAAEESLKKRFATEGISYAEKRVH